MQALNSQIHNDELAELPGADLVLRGMKEVHEPAPTECALLVLIGAPRLRRLGFDMPDRPDIPQPFEHRLYELLEETHGEGAYSRYNSLIRRLVSFEHAMENLFSKS
jgi:hypothetical protein